jgi:hypothetical protein
MYTPRFNFQGIITKSALGYWPGETAKTMMDLLQLPNLAAAGGGT